MSAVTTASAVDLADAVTPSRVASRPPRFLRRLDSPIGRIEITGDDEAITSLAIAKGDVLPHDGTDDATTPLLDRTAFELDEYFAGTRKTFDVPVSLGGTAFQRAVWNELRSLGWGAVTSYGEIGRATGRPTAGRAVGGAIGANPVPIIVGCHRVLASDNRITGYSGGNGIPTKVWLLDHEGITHA